MIYVELGSYRMNKPTVSKQFKMQFISLMAKLLKS